MSDTRVPRKESEFVLYLVNTTDYLIEPYRSPISSAVPANTTVNLLFDEKLPANMKVTVENLGAAGVDPPLHFCLGNTETNSCDPATAVNVIAGSSATVFIKQLGAAGKYNINVTNAHATDSSSCRITFQANWERLGLIEEVKQQWENDAALCVNKYQKANNPATATPNSIDEKNTAFAAFYEFSKGVLKTIEGSVNIVDADRNAFHIPLRDSTNTAREPIDDAPNTSVEAGAGCTVVFRHRTLTDASRASRHPLADCVEIRYVLLDISAPPPATPEACPNVAMFTKAKHNMTFPTADAGKRLHTFSRWRNNNEPEKSGPWSGLISIVLSF